MNPFRVNELLSELQAKEKKNKKKTDRKSQLLSQLIYLQQNHTLSLLLLLYSAIILSTYAIILPLLLREIIDYRNGAATVCKRNSPPSAQPILSLEFANLQGDFITARLLPNLQEIDLAGIYLEIPRRGRKASDGVVRGKMVTRTYLEIMSKCSLSQNRIQQRQMYCDSRRMRILQWQTGGNVNASGNSDTYNRDT